MSRYAYIALAAAAFLSLAGCASIDFDYPREESFAMTDTDNTTLGQMVTRLSATRSEDESGFYPLGNGIERSTFRRLHAEQEPGRSRPAYRNVIDRKDDDE